MFIDAKVQPYATWATLGAQNTILAQVPGLASSAD